MMTPKPVNLILNQNVHDRCPWNREMSYL